MKAGFAFVGLCIVALGGWVMLAGQSGSHILVEDAVAHPTGDNGIAIYMTLNNQGIPDRLLSVRSDAAAVTLMDPYSGGNLPVPLGRSALASDAAHIQVGDGTAFEEGLLLPVTLTFAQAGDVQLKAKMSEPAMQGHAMMDMDDMDMPDAAMDHADMHMPPPTVAVSAFPDGTGWRASIAVTDFTFAEDQMGMAHQAGTGHAHVYIGGMKLGRVFGADYQIGQLPTGSHDLRVTLNTNDHRPYMGADGPVMAKTVITVD